MTNRNATQLTLQGIAELRCWINFFPERHPTGRDTEECLDAHLAVGIRRVAWELGRSVLAYHSRLAGSTCWGRHDRIGELGEGQEIEKMLGERCSLRAALEYARTRDMTIYGRLSMNRFYTPGFKRSRLVDRHPEWMEIGKDGWVDPSRLCYALPEVRAERIAILLEAAELGCHGLLLDFCRQPPFVRFHPALVNPWHDLHGRDPRTLSWTDEPDSYLNWCRYRAEYITTFMRELRAALDQSKLLPVRPYPLQVRLPNDGLEANLIAGLDIARWCEEGLVQELAPSELHWLMEYREFDDSSYLELGRKHRLPVTISCSFNPAYGKSLAEEKGIDQSRCHNPLVLARRVLSKLRPGISGIAFFQSDRGVQLPGYAELLPHFANVKELETLINDPVLRERFPVLAEQSDYGIDHHSFLHQFAANTGRTRNGA